METTIQDILDDYEIEAPERTIKKEICEVLNDLLSTDFTIDDITYQKGTVWIDTDPMVRSQIHVKKQTIKEQISQRIKDRNISDIH